MQRGGYFDSVNHGAETFSDEKNHGVVTFFDHKNHGADTFSSAVKNHGAMTFSRNKITGHTLFQLVFILKNLVNYNFF